MNVWHSHVLLLLLLLFNCPVFLLFTRVLLSCLAFFSIICPVFVPLCLYCARFVLYCLSAYVSTALHRTTASYCTALCYLVLYCLVLYCAVLYCAALCCAVLCCTVLCCAVLYSAVLCCPVQCCAVLCCTVLCCTVLRYAVLLCCAVLYCVVLCCDVLYCVVLCCVVLCCVVLCCAVLCCAVLCAAPYCAVLYRVQSFVQPTSNSLISPVQLQPSLEHLILSDKISRFIKLSGYTWVIKNFGFNLHVQFITAPFQH